MEITLRPTLKQHEAYEALKNPEITEVVFGGGAGGGKSWLGCEWELMNAYRYPGSKWFIARKELTRLMGSTFITFNKVCKNHNVPTTEWNLNKKYNYIEFTNGSRIDLIDLAYKPTDPLYERLGSLEYTGGFVDEAGEINELAIDVLGSRVGRHLNDKFKIKGKTLYTANPTKNWIKRDFYLPYKNKTLSPYRAFVESLYTDNPHTADSYGETLSRIRNAIIRERLMSGNWDYEDQGSVFRGVEKCVKGQLSKPQIDCHYVLGVDVAKYKDFMVVVVLDLTNFHVVYFDRWNKLEYEYGKKKVEAIAKSYNDAFIIADATGVGDPFVEALKRDEFAVQPFVYTNKSKQNLIENLAIKIEQGAISFPSIEQLILELTSFTYEYLPGGTIRYNAPDGSFDDCVNALALAVHGAGHYPWEKRQIKPSYPEGSLGQIEARLDAAKLSNDDDHLI